MLILLAILLYFEVYIVCNGCIMILHIVVDVYESICMIGSVLSMFMCVILCIFECKSEYIVIVE